MPINPALALQVKGFELPDPMAQMAQVTQIQNALQQQRMGDIQMQNALREQSRQRELESIMGQLSPTAPVSEQAAALQKRGFFQQAQALTQQAAALANTRRQEEDARLKALTTKLDLTGRFFSEDAVKDQATYDVARQKAIAAGLDTEEGIPKVYDPAIVARLRFGAMSLKDQIAAKQREREVGARVTSAGAAASQAETAAAKLPFEQRRAEAAERLADQGRKTELEKLQVARNALPPGSPQRVEIENRIDALGRGAAPTLTEVIDPVNPNRMLRVDARTYTGGSVGSPGVLGVSGKEPAAAKRETIETEGREQFRSILDDLRANFDRLNQMRAITSTERGPISNVGTALETTGVGQVASRAVGGKAQAIRDEISSSRSMLLSALKKITGKSASELNSVVELRTFLDSISDPSKSYEAAINIIDNMERTYLRGGEPSAGQRSAAPRGAAPSGERSFRTVQEAEAANLPKGTRVTIGGRPAIVE